MSTTERESRRTRREREREERDEARRLLALGQIRSYPDPVLRLEARPVEEFSDDLRALVGRMTRLMGDAHGVGLAATQLGLLRRVFVFRSGDEEEGRAVVNPLITERSDEVATDDEGCLSLVGIHVPVERAERVVIEGSDASGEPVRVEATGMDARVIQHELDHLDGVLIIDRTTEQARSEAMRILRPAPGSRSGR